jgi:mannose-6-phosphate isomerase-like protein (cupin superfamily)
MSGTAVIQQADTLVVEDVHLSNNGGRGYLTLRHILPNDQVPHGRLFGQITMEQEAAMPLHTHHKETEFYYILQGEGIVTHDTGETKVHEGDMVRTGDGQSHAIRNEQPEQLVFIAAILDD